MIFPRPSGRTRTDSCTCTRSCARLSPYPSSNRQRSATDPAILPANEAANEDEDGDEDRRLTMSERMEGTRTGHEGTRPDRDREIGLDVEESIDRDM